MEKINIAFVSDINYFRHMCVAIESIIKNTSKLNNLNFFILNNGDIKTEEEFLKKSYSSYTNISFNFINVNFNKINELKTKTHVSSAAFAKIYLCDLVNVNKVIYLDCDLVVNDDIVKLWNDFEDDIIIKAVWNPFYDYDNIFLGIKDDKKTFNSGVMLLRLDLMRKNKSYTKLREFLEKYNDKTKLHDQAAFNAVFKNEWKELDEKWNVQVSMILNSYNKLGISKEKYFELLKTPSIIHFTSNSKPWQFRNAHPYKRLYKMHNLNLLEPIKYNDLTIKAFLQKIREKMRYKYYYLKNLI